MPSENAASHARARDLIQSREIPMLFSGPMVRAILAGLKTQTRRVVTSRTSLVNGDSPCMKADPNIISAWPNLNFAKAWVDRGPSPAGNPGPYLKAPGPDDSAHRVYSRTQPGDELWVRETWGLLNTEPCDGPAHAHVFFRATDGDKSDLRYQRWRPSIFMPRWASRVTLVVTEVRAQRLQNLSEQDARAEGTVPLRDAKFPRATYAESFRGLWDSINGKRPGCSWNDNPWVWAISFRRVE